MVGCLHGHQLQCAYMFQTIFLNHARTGHRPAHTWFLKIVSVRIVSMRSRVCACVCVCVCVCVHAQGYGMMWHDMNLI